MVIPLHDDNPTERFPFVTVAIIALNVFVYLLIQPQRRRRVWVRRGHRAHARARRDPVRTESGRAGDGTRAQHWQLHGGGEDRLP
jgi:hypothetical protein